MKWILNLSDMLSSLEIIILVAELKIQLAFTKTVNQDLTNNDINSTGLVSVAGC
jgi:hypothetical protein